MNLSSQVQKIKSAEDHSLSIHYWLEGFSLIDNNASLDTGLINQYIEHIMLKSKPFTALFSGSFHANNYDDIQNGKIRVVHLPVNEYSHLLFYLKNKDFAEQLIYTGCGPNCRVLPPYNFPKIELRKSRDFSNNPETMDSIANGTFYYDPSISIRQMKPDVIIETYNAMKAFIEYARINPK